MELSAVVPLTRVTRMVWGTLRRPDQVQLLLLNKFTDRNDPDSLP